MNIAARIGALVLAAVLSANLACGQFASSKRTPKTAKRSVEAAAQVEPPQDSFEFVFYYQRIDEVIPVQRGTPAAAVEAVRERASNVKRVPASDWRKRLLKADLTSEGRQEVRSDDESFRYKVFVTKVRDEAHLLRLMGTATDTSVLSDGQRALLAAYRHAKEQALIERMKQGARKRVEVVLTDTNGHDGRNVARDFWPYSNGDLLQINSLRFNTPDGEDEARSTMVHECAHSMDRAQAERDAPYGPDGTHYINEVIKPRAAFMEGWAVFLQMCDSPERASWWPTVCRNVKTERSKGVYDTASATALDGMTLTRVEGINGLVLLNMSKLPGGMEKLLITFRATNKVDRTLGDFLKDYVSRNPDQASDVARIFDDCTLGKLSDDEMKQFLGNGDAVKAFLLARQAAVEARATPSAAPGGASVETARPDDGATGEDVNVGSKNQRNPFLGGTIEP